MTHPTVTLQEEVTALPIPIRVRRVVNNLQQRTPGNKAIYSPGPINFIRMVAMKELPHRQPLGTVGHGAVQDLQCYEDPSGVGENLVDG